MRIVDLSADECKEVLNSASVGRLACSVENQPYVVPTCFVYEPEHLYVFSTLGQKIKWMRQNPKICLQTDQIGDRSNWRSEDRANCRTVAGSAATRPCPNVHSLENAPRPGTALRAQSHRLG